MFRSCILPEAVVKMYLFGWASAFMRLTIDKARSWYSEPYFLLMCELKVWQQKNLKDIKQKNKQEEKEILKHRGEGN